MITPFTTQRIGIHDEIATSLERQGRVLRCGPFIISHIREGYIAHKVIGVNGAYKLGGAIQCERTGKFHRRIVHHHVSSVQHHLGIAVTIQEKRMSGIFVSNVIAAGEIHFIMGFIPHFPQGDAIGTVGDKVTKVIFAIP